MILGVLIVLTPIGLILGGETFGENATSTLWNAPMADYGIPGVSTTIGTMLGYVASAIVGVAVMWRHTIPAGKIYREEREG